MQIFINAVERLNNSVYSVPPCIRTCNIGTTFLPELHDHKLVNIMQSTDKSRPVVVCEADNH